MNQLSSAPAWPVFKRKLKQHYQHLTDADLTAIESDDNGWLEKLQRVVGRSALEIARLADEAAEEWAAAGLNPVWLAFVRSEEWRSRYWYRGAVPN
jgi:hypothetical protein